MKHARQAHTQRNRFWDVVFYVALIVFIGSLVSLGALVFSYWQGQQSYETVAHDANVDLSVFDTSAPLEAKKSDITIDWPRLQAINPDIKAWIYIPGTKVNYPIVQGSDNEYYLTHDAKRTQGLLTHHGSIFQDYRNTPRFSDQVNFLYGHHMRDGSMFAAIAAMRMQANYEAQRDVYIFTPEQLYHLRSFSLLFVNADDPLVQPNFPDRAAFNAYITDKMNRNVVETPDMPEASGISKLFALITCDNNIVHDGRCVLYCNVVEQVAVNAATSTGSVSSSFIDKKALGELDAQLNKTVPKP